MLNQIVPAIKSYSLKSVVQVVQFVGNQYKIDEMRENRRILDEIYEQN